MASKSAKKSKAPKTKAHKKSTKVAKGKSKPAFLPAMRSLAQAYQAFSSYSDKHVRSLGLTSPQFDVIATLGNTEGMSMKDLAEATLVTKGTLTGIVDRLEKKDLVRRSVPPRNRRSFNISLTEAGNDLFQDVFPKHLTHLKARFDGLSETELQALTALLHKLKGQFEIDE